MKIIKKAPYSYTSIDVYGKYINDNTLSRKIYLENNDEFLRWFNEHVRSITVCEKLLSFSRMYENELFEIIGDQYTLYSEEDLKKIADTIYEYIGIKQE